MANKGEENDSELSWISMALKVLKSNKVNWSMIIMLSWKSIIIYSTK